MRCHRGIALILCVITFAASLAQAADTELPVVAEEDFQQGAARWEYADEAAWKVEAGGSGKVLALLKKHSDYKPPFRSPYNMALLKDVQVSDFQLTARVQSTEPDYGHRSLCLFFGYQDPAHFYYVHFGKKTDAHANQIFIVDNAARTKISTKTTDGTPWDDNWHTLRVARDAASGTIAVYFDDMNEPVMTAVDKTFTWGRIGVGSFDDRGVFDQIELRGEVHKPN
ncbi:MAG: hypothetical protein KDA42_09280 [Planctomycetales bacterium]|nr:hypothetical protein [Planctomycetales bacterium]